MKTKQKIIDTALAKFESNQSVKLDGLTYCRGINDKSFYAKIASLRLKLIGK